MKKYYVLHDEQIVGTFSEGLLTETDRAAVATATGLFIVPASQVVEGEAQHG